MGKCRSCGAEVKWVELSSGKYHPCDPGKVHIDTIPGSAKLVTDAGKIISHKDNVPFEEGYGYQSHFSSCPDADDWRAKKK